MNDYVLEHELQGVLADWEHNKTFDETSANTIRRVVEALSARGAPAGETPYKFVQHCSEPLYPPKAGEQQAVACSQVTQTLVRLIKERDAKGLVKYGKTLDRTDLTLDEWLQHMIEELLDAAGYAEAAKNRINGGRMSDKNLDALQKIRDLASRNPHAGTIWEIADDAIMAASRERYATPPAAQQGDKETPHDR